MVCGVRLGFVWCRAQRLAEKHLCGGGARPGGPPRGVCVAHKHPPQENPPPPPLTLRYDRTGRDHQPRDRGDVAFSATDHRFVPAYAGSATCVTTPVRLARKLICGLTRTATTCGSD